MTSQPQKTNSLSDDRLISVRVAATLCGVTTRTIYKWIAEGLIPVTRFGRTVRIPYRAVIDRGR